MKKFIVMFGCILATVLTTATWAEDHLGCMTTIDVKFQASSISILPKTATTMTPIDVPNHSNILIDCQGKSLLSVGFQMSQQSDLDVGYSRQDGQYYYYKIRSVAGRTSGSAAIEYLIQHAYLAFSTRILDKLTSVQVSDSTQNLNLLPYAQNEIDMERYKLSIGLSNIQFYFDALPTNDTIVNELVILPIQLNLGQLNIQHSSQDGNSIWSPNIAPQIDLYLSGIEFQRGTCTVKDQTVILDEVAVSAFHHDRPTNVGNPRYFDLDVQCSAYLNQRTLNAIWQDNNQLDNMNNIGYLSSAKTVGITNVGIQIRDEHDQPISIGQTYDLTTPIQGKTASKRYSARYYLAEGPALVGKVNAQATLQISYR